MDIIQLKINKKINTLSIDFLIQKKNIIQRSYILKNNKYFMIALILIKL